MAAIASWYSDASIAHLVDPIRVEPIVHEAQKDAQPQQGGSVQHKVQGLQPSLVIDPWGSL